MGRLLQLLCESSADIGLQLLRAHGYQLASSYREVFAALRDQLGLPDELVEQVGNRITHTISSITSK
ncbi:MAG: hypothetical protein ACLFSI_08300 [Halorhodospira sp.]